MSRRALRSPSVSVVWLLAATATAAIAACGGGGDASEAGDSPVAAGPGAGGTVGGSGTTAGGAAGKGTGGTSAGGKGGASAGASGKGGGGTTAAGGKAGAAGKAGGGGGTSAGGTGGAGAGGAAGSSAAGTAGTGTAAGGSSGAAGSGGAAGSAGSGGSVSTDYPCPGCVVFPPSGTTECPPATLAPASIAYPPNDVLLPPNMNVLEVQFVPPAGATLFEVDFENAVTDVKVETLCNPVPDVRGGASKGCGVTLPQGAWNDVANANRDGDPVHVTVRSTIDGACVSTSTTMIDLHFAKDDLAGGIYYWQSGTYGGVAGKTGGIFSHDFGSFDPTPIPFYTSGGTGTCVGCHNLSRDGARIALATDDPDADDEFGDVKTHMMDVATRTVVGGSSMSPGFQTFTHDHSKTIASAFKTQMNKGFDILDGDGHFLVKAPLPTGLIGTQPDLSADDATLVFVAPGAGTIAKAGDHHFLGGSLYTTPFDVMKNTLGMPTLLFGATTGESLYYPSFSPNGSFVVLNENADATAGNNDGDSFYSRKSVVKLLHWPASGGLVDLAALNGGAPANSWPRWSPFVQTYKGHKLLWLTFSSNRDYGLHLQNASFDACYPPESPMYDQPQPLSKQGVTYDNCAQPQIWMAAVVVDEDPSLDTGDRSFPAFWLPFQDVNAHNHSAQWVESVMTGGGGSGGAGGSGASGNNAGGSGGGPLCVEAGASCASALCCADVVCCDGACAATCSKP